MSGYYNAAQGWWNNWGSVVDGFFSWESTWPQAGGTNDGDVTLDKAVAAEAVAHQKSYMIGPPARRLPYRHPASAHRIRKRLSRQQHRVSTFNKPCRYHLVQNNPTEHDLPGQWLRWLLQPSCWCILKLRLDQLGRGATGERSKLHHTVHQQRWSSWEDGHRQTWVPVWSCGLFHGYAVYEDCRCVRNYDILDGSWQMCIFGVFGWYL